MGIAKLNSRKTITLTTRKKEMYGLDAKTIKFFRRNPVIACEMLLGIKLMDSQKWILANSWTAQNILWCCSRNFGKSFLGSIMLLLKALLYENQGIYICSTVGDQSKETFSKIEEIVLRKGKTSNSILSLKDICEFEVVTSPACKTGFSHPQSGYKVKFYNGSEITTLNGDFDNNRGKRATLILFDEVGFMSNEAIGVIEAFGTQNTEFKTSIEDTFNIKAEKRKCPTQFIYCSSASSVDTTFFKYYKQFFLEMLAGNRNYFVADMPCEVVLHPYIDGKPSIGLLTQDVIDKKMKENRVLAEREYYNKFDTDGGEDVIVKWATIRRNETFLFPELYNKDNSQYIITLDPARTNDQAPLLAMKICYDENIIGKYYGEIVNCSNLTSMARKKSLKTDSTEQINTFKEQIIAYNGNDVDYKNIYGIGIDSGAGGGGISVWGDNLLSDWKDSRGITHKGFIDLTYKNKDGFVYEGYDRKYPNADTKTLKLLSPKAFRTQMCDEFVELMENDFIKFPKTYDGKGYISYTQLTKDGKEEEMKTRNLSPEEEEALIGIEALKYEITSIYKFWNKEHTSYTYALAPDKASKGDHDDRFYAIIMASHFLYELRRQNIIVKNEAPQDISKFLIIPDFEGSSQDWVQSNYIF